MVANALRRFAQDPAFPAWYGALFRRRVQFGITRIAVSTRPMNMAILAKASLNTPADRLLLSAAARLPAIQPVRAILLGWLWLRFWPMNPWLVLRSAISRYFTRASP